MADIYCMRKYGTAALVYTALQTRDLMDYKAAPTLAAGDVTIDLDGAGFASIEGAGTFGNFVKVLPAAGIQVQLLPDAAALTCKKLTIKIIDQTAAKEWEDQFIVVETYGHPSAQHPFDFSIPSKGFTNVIRTNTAQAGSTSSTLVLDASASGSDDTYNGRLVFITGGTGVNQMALITDYTGSSKTATIRCLSDTALWITTPDATSTFSIFDRDPQFAASVWKAPASVYADTGSLAKLLEDGFANAMAELAADPGATPTLLQAAMFLYMHFRNARTQGDPTLASKYQTMANDAGTTILRAPVSDDGSLFTKGKFAVP